MRSLLRVAVSAVAALLVVSLSGAQALALPVLPGDLNLDGRRNVSDVQCAVLAVANPANPPACLVADLAEADITCDGSFNVSDLQLLVILAVGNPLSAVVDPDGDTRIGLCDPDRDGDSWSNDCEALASTDPLSAADAPTAGAQCPDTPLSTACRISGQAGDPFRCDVQLSRVVGTQALSGVSFIVQVDPKAARIDQLDLLRDCDFGPCLYDDPAPPAVALPTGQLVELFPSCDDGDCTNEWQHGAVGVTVHPSPGDEALTGAIYQGALLGVAGDAFLVSIVGTLAKAVDDLPVEVFDAEGSLYAEDGFDAALIDVSGEAVMVSFGPPEADGSCIEAFQCDDGNPCTVDDCVGGFCEHQGIGGPCDDGDACTEGDACAGGACVGTPKACDDGVACTTDGCAGGHCTVALAADLCAVGGSCFDASAPVCKPHLVLSEVGPDYFAPDDDLVEVFNAGASTVLLVGVTLSSEGHTYAVPGVTVAPGDFLVVHTGTGNDLGLELHADGALGDLSLSGGEMALLQADEIVGYVTWGAGPSDLAGAATAAGVWQDGVVLAGGLGAGTTYQSASGTLPTTWSGADGTPGAAMPFCVLSGCLEVACADGEDNDFDLQPDCLDGDCLLACGGVVDEICGDGADNDQDGAADCLDSDCAAEPACAPRVALTEVVVVEGGDSLLELTNAGAGLALLDGLLICNGVGCQPLPDTGILANTYLTVHTGVGVDSFGHVYLGGGIDLTPAAGELVLTSANPPVAGSVLSYLRWGDAPGNHDAAAVGSSQWQPGAAIFSAAFQPGDSFAANSSASKNATAWDIHITPSPGVGNPNCGTPGQCRESRCADAIDDDGDGNFDCQDGDCGAYSACAPRVVLNEVIIDGPDGDLIELANLGGDAASLSGWRIQFNAGAQFLLTPAGELLPGEILLVHSSAGTAEDGHIFGAGFNLDPASGELVLASGSTSSAVNYRDYVRWGDANKVRESKAVEAQQWEPATFVDPTGLVPGVDALLYDGLGDTAADWRVGPMSPGASNGLEFGNCGDAVDNDNDGQTDCLDTDCAGALQCLGEICGNGLDDDFNDATDCEDPFCIGTASCVELGKCGDGVDNDNDGLTDCEDTDDCADANECDESLHCDDATDNDGDGLTDCEDTDDCQGKDACVEVGNCADGIDNDGDGLTDCEQTAACQSEDGCIELFNCGDGIDNDLDGLTDCDDLEECEGTDDCIEFVCDDLQDDDGDGSTDCDDSDCVSQPVCVGAEPVIVINELFLETGAGTDVVELRNIAPATGDLSGWLLCLDGSCYPFPPGTTLGPAAFLLVETGTGADFDGHLFAGGALGDPSPASGEAGLHRALPLDDVVNLVDWMQWGEAGHSGEAVAAAGGQWEPGTAVPNAAYSDGTSSFIWLGTGEGVEHWTISHSATPGADNTDCGVPGACAELDCSDDLDGDGDGAVDCLDFDCFAAAACFVEAGNCDDNLDNDSDNLTDCADQADCGAEEACDEALNCADQTDNDLDGEVDCADEECATAPGCQEGLHCADGIDNDKDGLYDCGDPDCDGDTACIEDGPECDDNADNDEDGATDCEDADCAGHPACDEGVRCFDGVDNDYDGLTDCFDLEDCAGAPDCQPRLQLGEIAFDAAGGGPAVEIANAGDGLIDVSRYWLCVGADCAQLRAEIGPIGPFQTHRVYGDSGEDTDQESHLEGLLATLSATAGSARLYSGTSPTGQPAVLVDFVQWGATGQPGEAEAIQWSKWLGGWAIPTDQLGPGQSLGRYGITFHPTNWTLRPTASVGNLEQPCEPGVCLETWCDDDVDNDDDGAKDCADAFCDGSGPCIEPGNCGDGLDNDGDGRVDCYDDECAGAGDCALGFRLSEVQLDGSGGGAIELVNPLSIGMNLSGVRACTSTTSCFAIPDDTTLDPGAYLTLHTGAGSDSGTDLYTGAALGTLGLAGGTLAITDGGEPDDGNAVLAFVGWGLHGGALHQAAVTAGLWIQSETVQLAAHQIGDSLISDTQGTTLAHWNIATAGSLGASNPDCAVPLACRESHCSDGADDDADTLTDCTDDDCSGVPGCAARMVLNEVHIEDPAVPGDEDWVELYNAGADATNLNGWRLCSGIVGSNCHVFGNFPVPPGAFIVVHASTGVDDESNAFAGTAYGDLKADKGHFSLHSSNALSVPTAMVDYVSWGQGGRPRESTAVAAGQWAPGGFVPMDHWTANGSNLIYLGTGDSHLSWNIVATATAAAPNPTCTAVGTCLELVCTDGLDDDADGLVDCADPECAVFATCREDGNCADQQDNDGDGLVDCGDSACAEDDVCNEALNCADGIDNDLNGVADCAAIECKAKAHCIEATHCNDGIDNDVDGQLDCSDADCVGHADCPEAANCADLVDNDGDGLTDCADTDDCGALEQCQEDIHCTDLVDNDADGLIDCSDVDCASDAFCAAGLTCTEQVINTCGEPASASLAGAPSVESGDASGCEMTGAGPAMVHKLTAECDGLVTVTIDSQPGDDVFVRVLDAYCNTNAHCTELFGEQFTVPTVAGVDYFFTVARSPESTGSGQYTLTIACTACSETSCSDGIDNDINGATDCDDTSCAASPDCAEGFACDNGIDDDLDGLTDCDDDQCFDADACDEAQACQDGLDNDGDGLTDCSDPDCPHYSDGDSDGFCESSEHPGSPHTFGDTCFDGVDNDSDGFTDCQDANCALVVGCNEAGSCDDGVDNDADGKTDCSDNNCANEAPCTAGVACSHHAFLSCGQTIGLHNVTNGSDVIGDNYCGHENGHAGSKESIIRFTPPCDGDVRATLSHNANGSFTVSVLEAACNSASWCGGVTPWFAPASSGVETELIWSGNKGVPYYLVVEGLLGTAGDFELTVECLACAETSCGDGLDQDGDGLTDCDDSDCLTISPCATETNCEDQIDDDQDGKVDCFDVDCAGVGVCWHACEPRTRACGSVEIVDLATAAGLTDTMASYSCSANDYSGPEEAYQVQIPFACDPTIAVELLDGATAGSAFADLNLLDSAQPACTPEACVETAEMDADGRALLTPDGAFPGQSFVFTVDGRSGFQGSYRLAVSCCGADVESFCSGGVDDDADGLTDCEDHDCDDHPGCLPEVLCDDGVDNDNDGHTDCADSDCGGVGGCFESTCDDGLDNEGDGATDCDDTDCAFTSACFELLCSDGESNDDDDLVDCDDPDCAGTVDCVQQCAAFLELACGSILTSQHTTDGVPVFDEYSCDPDPPDNCGVLKDGFGITPYPGAELGYAITPDCDGEAIVTVTHAGDDPFFYVFYVGNECDETTQSCDGICTDPTWGADGTSLQPAKIMFPLAAYKAHWVVVEPDAFAPPQGASFNISVDCFCQDQ